METENLEVVYKPTADKQIYKLMIYIDENGYPDTAVNFAQRLYKFGDSLGFMPNKFPICRHPKLAKRNLHCTVFESNYIFIYKVVRKKLTIYSIVHCKRLNY